MWICPACEGSRWVQEVVDLEYINGMDEVFLVERRVSVGPLKCVHCGFEGNRTELTEDTE